MRKDNTIGQSNREYKDSVFVDLFSIDEKTRTNAVIPLYNALHKEKITNETQVQFIRIENVLFRKIRNDVSFMVDDKLIILLEHQSTINENMPFRCLEYILALYQTQLDPRLKFTKTKITLPAPEFYVLYNGKAPYPARKKQYLSDLFKNTEKQQQLELIVSVININHPDNKNFLESCPYLKGYKKLIEKVEQYKIVHGDRGYAKAIEECIKENMEISEYLKRKMQEVMEMFTAEYSYELELEASKEDGIREGIEKGIEKGLYTKAIDTAKNLIQMGLSLENIAKATGLSKAEVEKL